MLLSNADDDDDDDGSLVPTNCASHFDSIFVASSMELIKGVEDVIIIDSKCEGTGEKEDEDEEPCNDDDADDDEDVVPVLLIVDPVPMILVLETIPRFAVVVLAI